MIAMMEEICIPGSVNIVKSVIHNYFFTLKQNDEVNPDPHGLTYIYIFVSRFPYIIARILFIC